MPKTVCLLLTRAETAESTATALALAERIFTRGHRVTVFAQDEAVTLAAGTGEAAEAVAALVRRGLHGGTLDWVAESSAVARLGVQDNLVPGVLPGDHADLWAFVRAAEIVLSPSGGA